MSFEISNGGWFGWDMPAWIASGSEGQVRQCRIRNLSSSHAKLEVDRPHAVPDRFVLKLTASGSLALECKVITRERSMIEVEFGCVESEYGPTLSFGEGT